MSQAPASHRRPRGRLGTAALGSALVALVLALAVAPPDAVQGHSQRLMYLHVPAAWTAFLAFGVVAVASLGVLLDRPGRWDAVAGSSAELGVVMTALALVQGSLWGQAAWGVWWAWDPRVVTTTLLLLLYLAYLGLRALPGEPSVVRRRAAVAGLALVIQVPVVHFSVLWWRTLHQPPSVLRPEVSVPMEPSMLLTLMVSVVAFVLGGAWYVARRTAVDAGRPAGGTDAVPIDATTAGAGR